jgi:hypothetical protein
MKKQVLNVIPSSYLIKLSRLLTLAVTQAELHYLTLEMVRFGLVPSRPLSLRGPKVC